MYEKYYVVNEFGETVGNAWFSSKSKFYLVDVPSLGIDHDFETFEEMEHYLWSLGLDAV